MSPEFAYTVATGRLFMDVSQFHEQAEALLERPILTHEFAEERTWATMRENVEAHLAAAVGGHGVRRVNHGDVWRSKDGDLRTTLMVCGTSGEAIVSGMDFEMPLAQFLATHEPVSFAYPEADSNQDTAPASRSDDG